MRILVGDVGGTKTLLALHEGPDARSLREVRRARFENAVEDGISPILRAFVDPSSSLDAAVIGVAGPVYGDLCNATNIPWTIDAREISRQLSIAKTALLNDFEAIALGLDDLPDEALVVLQDRPIDRGAPKAVIGAGTGLGEAIVVPRECGLPRVLPSEGGHVDFAPRDDAEIDLLRHARERFGRVSVERIVSGPGLAMIYERVVASCEAAASPAAKARLDAGEDPGAVIGELRASDAAASIAVKRFVSLLGAQAGNLALRALPFGGLYVAGGIAPKLVEVLEAGTFLDAFRAKAPMEALLDRIPVRVVMDSTVGLLGARRKAIDLLRPGAGFGG